jgi:hypothetical protein
MNSPFFPNTHQNMFFNKIIKVSGGRLAGCASSLLVLRIIDFTSFFDISHSLQLPLIQVQSCQDFGCDPVPPERYNKMGAALLKVRLRKSRLPSPGNRRSYPLCRFRLSLCI